MHWDFTPKQHLLIEYLLQRLGFDIGAFSSEYIREFSRFSHFDDYNQEAVFINIAIQALQQEINLKSDPTSYLRPVDRSTISASEIENFTFCPVAFSIAATFNLPRNQQSISGSDFHEQELLNPNFRKLGHQYGLAPYTGIVPADWNQAKLEHLFGDYDAGLLDDLHHSEIIYSDATAPREQIFRSKKGAYRGRPDYIFRNKVTGNVYVVEEKFSLLTTRRPDDRPRFYKNHVNQLRSYIYCISDFDIAYGYLVYWKYRYYRQEPSISSAFCKRLEKSDLAKNDLESVYRAIQSVIRTGRGTFDDGDRYPRKCANCGAMLFCGHKTGKYDEFSYPYSLDHLRLHSADLPELLVKSSKKDTITIDGKVHSLKEKMLKVYCRRFVSSLNEAKQKLNYSRYNAEWVVIDGRLYLDRFVFYTEKLIEGRREALWEYIREPQDDRFMSFISGEVECYFENDADDHSAGQVFRTVHLKINKGLVSVCELSVGN